MTNAYIVTGTLTDGTTVKLDEPLPVAGGKVRVTLEVVASPSAPKQAWRETMERIWAGQKAHGHVPMSVEEVEAYIKGERDSWGDR